jgi:hypothetical protein
MKGLIALKDEILRAALPGADPEVGRLLRLAAGEAEALAWETGWPMLVFPLLLEEKIAEVRRYIARQRRVWVRSGFPRVKRCSAPGRVRAGPDQRC